MYVHVYTEEVYNEALSSSTGKSVELYRLFVDLTDTKNSTNYLKKFHQVSFCLGNATNLSMMYYFLGFP